MITSREVSYQYFSSERLRFPDVRLATGEHCLMLGQSGSGKTTLLHLMGGLLRGYTGSIQISGTELKQLSETELDRFRGQQIGFVFQRNHLVKALTVEQNLMLVPFLSGKKVSRDRIGDVLDNLSIADKRKSKIGSLSQGQAQRVAIARALLHMPAFILADEPTSALDDKHCAQVVDLLLKNAGDYRATVLIATHDQRLKSIFSNTVYISSQPGEQRL